MPSSHNAESQTTLAGQQPSAASHVSLYSANGDLPPRLAQLEEDIKAASHFLPSQRPILGFVHHNTLEAFEELPFAEGAARGGALYGREAYLAEDEYRRMLTRGRIREGDLRHLLDADLGERAQDDVLGLGTRFELRFAMLRHSLHTGGDAELRWLMAETDALRSFREDIPAGIRQKAVEETRHWVMRDLRDGQAGEWHARNQQIRDRLSELFQHFGEKSAERWSEATWESFHLHALWQACRDGVASLEDRADSHSSSVRHRDLLLEATGDDSDRLVAEVLVWFCAAFLDQDFAYWRLPNRDAGFYRAFLELYGQAAGPPHAWLRGLKRELDRLAKNQIGPLESIEESLEFLGVAGEERETFLTASLLSLSGWAGMVRQLEAEVDCANIHVPEGTLVEYLAVQLILERFALSHIAADRLDFEEPLSELRQARKPHIVERSGVAENRQAFLVFQLAQAMGWLPAELFSLSPPQWSALIEEIDSFPSIERRQVFQNAFERRYYHQILDAISIHAQPRPKRTDRPRFQFFCCFDDREESFRRHLEEVAPDVETYGVAGFYSIPMYYRGAADANFAPQCPVVVTPQHWVVEDVGYSFEAEHQQRTKMRRSLGTAQRGFHVGSRSFFRGIGTSLLGSLASIPLVARVIFPRSTSRLRQQFGHIIEPPPVRQLILERSEATPGPEGGHIGFTVKEMADCVELILRDSGCTSNFARLIVLVGHGSSSMNNPHEAAYNCGACAGKRGGPNARAFAQMANDPRIRSLLREKGLEIPEDTVFVGGYHNTCNDNVEYFDLDRLPRSHKADMQQAQRDINETRARNAHERCRRFATVPLNCPPEAALRHVEGRAEDLAQTRPEYNHATNAVTILGRRARTRGLYMDRRVFVPSYDPTQDDDDFTILTRNLKTAVPVCAGIALEYYFSCVDPYGWGCDTKLPHNPTAMLGVMLGAASDLQPGLTTQMVDIHEPLRHLFIVEATPETMRRVLDENPAIDSLCRNEWVFLATLDPDSTAIHIYRNGQFERYEPETDSLPEMTSSAEWYRGWRDNLGFAALKTQPV